MKILGAFLAGLTDGWLVDLNGVPIDQEDFVFNPLCKNRIKPSAQAKSSEIKYITPLLYTSKTCQ